MADETFQLDPNSDESREARKEALNVVVAMHDDLSTYSEELNRILERRLSSDVPVREIALFVDAFATITDVLLGSVATSHGKSKLEFVNGFEAQLEAAIQKAGRDGA